MLILTRKKNLKTLININYRQNNKRSLFLAKLCYYRFSLFHRERFLLKNRFQLNKRMFQILQHSSKNNETRRLYRHRQIKRSELLKKKQNV